MGIRSLLRKVFGRDRADQHDETPATSVPPQADRATSEEQQSVTLPSPTSAERTTEPAGTAAAAPERARASTPAPTRSKESAAQRAADDLVAAAFDNPKVPGARSAEPKATEATEAVVAVQPETVAAEAKVETAAAEAEPEATAAAEAEAEAEALASDATEATDATTEADVEAVDAAEAEPEALTADAAVEVEPSVEADVEAADAKAEPETTADVDEAEAATAQEVAVAEPEAEAPIEPEAEAVVEPEAQNDTEADAAEPQAQDEFVAAASDAAPVTETAPEADVSADTTPGPEAESETSADDATEPEAALVTDETAPEPEAALVTDETAPEPVAAAVEATVTESPEPKAQDTPATSLARVKADAPHLVDAYKAAGAALKKQGLVGARAAVYLVVDRSGSMRGYFKDGSVQRIAEQTVALAAHLDEDATVTAVFFSTDIDGTAELRPQGLEGRIDEINAGLGRLGRTNYHRAVEEVLAHHEKADPTRPAFVVFQTDGAPESKTAATQALAEAADRPIHWQFVAWGEEDNKAFDYLRKLTAPRTGHFLAGATPSETAHSAFYGGLLADWQI